MPIRDTSYTGQKLPKEELKKWRVSQSMKQAEKFRQEAASYGGGTWKGAASSVANKVANKVIDNPLVSLRGATDTFSSSIARMMSSPEERKYIEKPTASQMGGAIAQTALTLYPGSTIAKGVKFVAGSLLGKIAARSAEKAVVGTATTLAKNSLNRGISKLAGNVASFGGAGYGYETSQKLIEGKTGTEAYTPGAQTAVSAALPFTPLALTGVKKTIGRVAQETFGATTGTGMGVVRAAYEAAKEGGEKAAQFTKAMRGNTSPDEIVSAAKESLGEIIQRRSTAYEAALTKVKGMTDQIDTTPIQNAIETGLKKFGVEVTEEGLDFSRSTLRFNKKAQEEINTIVNEMAGFGSKVGDNSPIGVDRLKRAFSDLYSDSSEARAFVANVTGETRKLLSKVPGYDEMSKSYGEATGLIKEIQKGLSLGNKASVDTAFRKLSTTLRTNNEFRQQLVDELDKISGGTLSAQVAGQQLSEKLPRGLAKIGLAGAGGIGLATGGLGVVALLKLAAVSSPRLIGEFANALGVSARYFGKFLEAIGVKAGKEILQKTRLPGDILLDSSMGKKLKESVKNMKGKGGLSIQAVGSKADPKAQGTKRGFGTGAGRPKSITKAQDNKITKNSLQEVLQDGAKEYIKKLENAKVIDLDAIQKYQDLIKRAPKITDIASLTRNIAELERKSKLKLMDEATKIRDEVFDGIRKRNLKK